MKKSSFLVVGARAVPSMPSKTLLTTDVVKGYFRFFVVRSWKKTHKGCKYVGCIRVLGYAI